MMRLRRHITGLVAALVISCSVVNVAFAQTLIRDTEIEAMLRAISDPIFQAAGLAPGAVDVYIVQDEGLNAFVAGGQNLFLNTGLLTEADRPEQLAGVIAHEAGHIAGGHLTRGYAARERAGAEMLIGSLLGLAAAVAGAPDLGAALAFGGVTVAQQGMLAFSRGQEQSADQSAIEYMGALGLPPDGLREFFQILESSTMRIYAEGDAFLRTHPLTRDRINFIDNAATQSPHKGGSLGPELQEAFARSVAKLDAFLGNPRDTLPRYAGDSVIDRYARAIAYYKQPDLGRSLELIEGLIAEQADDPYFHELKGQILFENGRTAEAIAPYRQALALSPSSHLIRFGLARALLEQPERAATAEAADLFRAVARTTPDNAMAWRFLGIAEGKLGNHGTASLALSEAAVLRRDREEANLHLARAEQAITAADPSWIRLQDLKRAVERMPDEPRRP
jgi:predicted Zn-dependent protease